MAKISGHLTKGLKSVNFTIINDGEALYPYGFACHWFKALEEHTQHEDGSWSFKVGVTITNQYGASREAVASAYINNTMGFFLLVFRHAKKTYPFMKREE